MHFAIPDTEERHEGHGKSFTVYHVHINGLHHCSVRFRQLHSLHHQLRQQLDHSPALPPFPSKKLLPLTASQLEERRLSLEKYLQLLSQDPRVAGGAIFNGFLLGGQQETHLLGQHPAPVLELDVCLANEVQVRVRGPAVTQSTDEVLERVCRQLGVPDGLVHCFALMLMVRQPQQKPGLVIVRKLQGFESPFVSQRSLAGSQLVLRKWAWDAATDQMLLSHHVTLNLLFIQTQSDLDMEWIEASPDTRRQLSSLKAAGDTSMYMELAKGLKYYGYLHFVPCSCDFPRSHTGCQVLIGGRELVLRLDGQKDAPFRVTKMRCWRIMTVSSAQTCRQCHEPIEKSPIAGSDGEAQLELSFEYLMAHGEMQWISIVSSQAIIMSLCLQAMVEEMLRLKNAQPMATAGGEETGATSQQYVFQKCDGSELVLPVRTTDMTGRLTSRSLAQPAGGDVVPGMDTRQYSAKSLSERFRVVKMRDASRAAEEVFIENEVFVDVVAGDEGP